MKDDVSGSAGDNAMRHRIRVSALLTVAAVLATLYACDTVNLETGNAGTIAGKDTHSLSPSEIIATFAKHDWSNEQRPENLIMYCDALVESSAPLPRSLREGDVPFHIAEFSRAYFMFRNGRVKEAEAIFSKLTADQDRSIWGLVGLLETALYTQNIASMNKWLAGLRELKKSNDVVAAAHLPIYALHYEFYMANYEQAGRILDEIGPAVESLLIHVYLLIRENRFQHADRLIDHVATLSDRQSRDVIIMARAELIAAQYGFEKSTKYLEKMSEQFPEMWQVRLFYASHLTALRGQGAREIAVRTLLSLASTRKHDLATQLVIINVLLDLQAYEEAGGMINSLSRAHEEFYYYNLVLAKVDNLMGDYTSLHLNLSEARAMFPMAPDGLWFAYRVSASNGDYEEAAAVLKMLLKLDPHDPYVLASLAQTYIEIGKWQEAETVASSVLESRRYVDGALRREMEGYQSRALGNLN